LGQSENNEKPFMRRQARKLELFSMLLMILGVAALCQPWNLFLHSYGATIILAGLILFNIFSRIKSPPETEFPGKGDISAP
jgi:hypothetical protein